ncbi:hypothetical protein ACFUNF_42355 [Streptomyces sp. NPDC057291]|uniref:hypothetical protein n=1 Tax=Streptomyces sp. NPDC057291 TaxID=3346087 RepID=UPI003642DAE5
MTTECPTAPLLQYSDFLTLNDAGPLRVFLASRLSALTAHLDDGSEEHFAATALTEIAVADGQHLAQLLEQWEEVLAHKNEPQGPAQALRQDVRLWWNRLARLAARWSDHPDFSPRWQELRYFNAQHHTFVTSAEQTRSFTISRLAN